MNQSHMNQKDARQPLSPQPQSGLTVPVLLPVLVGQTYDYLIKRGAGEFQFEEEAPLQLSPGDFVRVPLGGREVIGVVWDRAIPPVDETGAVINKDIDPARLKAVIERLDAPRLPLVSMRFAEWTAQYTLFPVGQVLKMMMSAKQVFAAQAPRYGVMRAGGDAPFKMTPARAKVLAVEMGDMVWSKGNLADEAGVSAAVISGLVKAGALVEAEMVETEGRAPQPRHKAFDFKGDQVEAAHRLLGLGKARAFQVMLLDGVTGSGKTEVYFEALAGAIEAGRQVLVLLPEISLTNQFLDRFKDRFGCRPAAWHSALSDGARARLWRGVAEGEVQAVIGARSALFLPFKDLGVIVVDEEHDAGYKQDSHVLYHARDMAVVRASLGKAGVVLASATPSIESLINAQLGKYGHVELKSRFKGAALPDMQAIDMRSDGPERGRWLSPTLLAALRETMARGEQSLLFLNRRGYAPLTLCRGCGYRFQCPQCAAWLVEHKQRGALSCHHCGFKVPAPKACPKCEQTDSLAPCGPGVERISEEVAELLPEARQVLLSSDLVPNITALREALDLIHAGEADVIIGTQIVAKGHNFPLLSTVGIVDGDLGLTGAGDPRAAERSFQLLHQVAGRAGRMGTEGRGFVQTYLPDHPVMAAILSGDRGAFVDKETKAREMLTYPPYGRLVALIVSGKEKKLTELYAREVARRAPPSKEVMVLGPVEAPIAVIRGRHRFRLLFKAPKQFDVQGYMRLWQARVPKATGDLRLTVDVDPYHFL